MVDDGAWHDHLPGSHSATISKRGERSARYVEWHKHGRRGNESRGMERAVWVG